MARLRMTPSEAFVEVLAAQGVTHVFGIVGSAYMDALDLFPAAGIRFVPTVHEQGAAHMADGYSRVSGRHGVCIGQNGPGITNFVTAIAAAYWAHSPVVAVTPEAGSLTMGLGGFQETEQLAIFSKITKYQAHVTHPARMAELTARAFDRAHLELGPTQLNIPRDHFYGEIECEIPAPLRVSARAGCGRRPRRSRAAPRRGAPPGDRLRRRRGDVRGRARRVALAELLGAPVVNSYLHNDSFPASHPLACGPLGYHGSKAAMRTLAKADVVLALGSRLGPFGTLPQYGFDYWPAGAKLVQVDADPRVLGLVKKTAVAVCGDAREAAEALRERLAGRALARRRDPRRARGRGAGRARRVGAGAPQLGPRDRRLEPRGDGRRERAPPAAGAARARAGAPRGRDGLDGHRERLPDRQQLPPLRAAAQHVRRDDVRELRLRLPGDHRLQGAGARAAGRRVRRRRRLGHELRRAPDLRARAASP